MKNIKITLWALLIGMTLLWALADTFLPQPLTYFSLRHVLVQYTGVMAMAAMSVAVLLAVRPRMPERWLGGLDKMYRLHKWLGIGALVFGGVHWLWAKGTKWAVGWGWLTRPARGQAEGKAWAPWSSYCAASAVWPRCLANGRSMPWCC